MFFFNPIRYLSMIVHSRQADRTTLAKNLIRAASSDPTIPALQKYSRADQIGWRYYLGILEFRNGEDAKVRCCSGLFYVDVD